MVKYKGIIKYYEFNNNPSQYHLESLKKTLKANGMKIGLGNKQAFFDRVVVCLNNQQESIMKYTDKIVKIQALYRGYSLRGELYVCNLVPRVCNKLNNDSDFLTCDHWKKALVYYFACMGNDGFYYYFDIRSLCKLLKTNGKNPYNREVISKATIHNMNLRLSFLKRRNISLKIEDDYELDNNSQEGIKRISNDIFIELTTHGYNAHVEWFNKLSLVGLKNLYRALEDIWNYRSQLSIMNRVRIAPPDGRIFTTKVKKIYINNDIFHIKKLLVNDIKKLIFSGDTTDDRKLGMIYFITALSEVSHECLLANPWVSIINTH